MKRPMMMDPEKTGSDDPLSQLTAEMKIADSGAKLTVEIAEQFSRAMRPSSLEFSAMLNWLLQRKRWSVRYTAALLSIDVTLVIKIKNNVVRPSGPVGRVIWMLYMLDVAPGVVTDPLTFVTWGKRIIKLPKFGKRNTMRVQGYIKRLITLKARLTTREINQELAEQGIVYDDNSLRNQFAKLGYKPATTRTALAYLRPSNIWLQVDWSKNATQIATMMKCSRSAVVSNKAKLKAFPREQLARAFIAAGRPPGALDALLRCHLNIRKASQSDLPPAASSTS